MEYTYNLTKIKIDVAYIMELLNNAPVKPLFRLFFGALVALSLLFAAPASALATSPADAPNGIATITFADGRSVSISSGRERFGIVPVVSAETVRIDVRLPQSFQNAAAFVQPLDGGVASEIVVNPDGSASVSFQAGAEPGLYRLLLGARNKTTVLEFEVPAPAAPPDNG